MRKDRELPQEFVASCVPMRRSIWEQADIKGLYEVLNVWPVEIEDEQDMLIQLKKGNMYFTLSAKTFMLSFVVEDIVLFDIEDYPERLIDAFDATCDYILPEFIKVLGKHEAIEFINKTLILENI